MSTQLRIYRVSFHDRAPLTHVQAATADEALRIASDLTLCVAKNAECIANNVEEAAALPPPAPLLANAPYEWISAQETPPSTIDHPPHYTFGRLEVIDVIEYWDLGFHLGNAVKYIARAGKKGDALEDLRKAAWYLAREIERRSRG